MTEVFQSHPQITAFFSTRHHGYSQGKFHSLNLGFHVGDHKINVEKNHHFIKNYFINACEIVYMNQIHSNIVCDTGSLSLLPSCDALISDERKKILMVMVADCIPILLYDEKKHLISAVHAGRAGVFENIVKQSFQLLHDTYASEVKDLCVAIGPHIQACCYEVGEDIAILCRSLGYEDGVVLKDDSYYLDLYQILFKQLIDLGVDTSKIEYSDICTACDTKNYFSYRKEGQTGRFCGAIMLK